MHIVIDISKNVYEFACRYPDALLSVYAHAIKNGTPLPKGHGKLFDVNDLLDRIGLEDNAENREENVGAIITLEDFDFTIAIIDADKIDADKEESEYKLDGDPIDIDKAVEHYERTIETLKGVGLEVDA